MTLPIIPGLYGKLPAAGDFVTRRLPPQFVKTWDTWIQEALIASRKQLDAKWLDVYLTSPIWRFIMSPGNCDDNAAVGILMPSVDKVGRYFPLTLAATLDNCEILPYLFIVASNWFDALEQLALSALEDDLQVDAFDQKIQAQKLDPPILSGPKKKDPQVSGKDESQQIGQDTLDGKAPIWVEMDKLDHTPQAFQALGVCLLTRFYSNYSLWSTTGSDLLRPTLLVYQGLPPATDFSAFLTGDWLHLGACKPIAVSPFLASPALLQNDDDDSFPHADATNSIQWRSSGRSDVGKVRVLNEDAFLENPESGLWVVADGMGGHLAGDEASQTIVDTLRDITTGDTLEALIDDVTTCLQKTNADLVRRTSENNDGQIMGSTVVVMLAVGSQCATMWAGDSRLYRYRKGLLSQLTRDHSLENETMDADRSASAAPAGMNCSNVVTRAIGAESDLTVDTLTFDAIHEDTYLLCSDGLVKVVDPQEITAILSRSDPERCCHELIDLALARGARDNVTVVVVAAEHEADSDS